MINLNVKSNYSLLSSMLTIDEIIDYNLSIHNDICVLCDNNMYGVMEFYKKCLAKNIKPVIGLNIILEKFEIKIYCKNYTGYQSMIKLCTIQNERVVTIDDLKKYNLDLVAVLECKYINYYEEVKEIYPDLYVGYNNVYEEKKALNVTEDIVYFRECLYLNFDDGKYLRYLYLIRDGKTISDNINYDILNKQLITDDDLQIDNKGITNAYKIALVCNLEFPKNDLLLPIYETDKGMSASKYLFELCKLGLKKRIPNITKDYQDRLSYELNIIDKMGFSNYFLVVYDFIRYAKTSGILVGPGRGSAAGSLVAYCLGITEIDPLKYNLLFERFLNPERKGMPDMDSDFPDEKREQVIEYVIKKYGKKHVSGIVTFGSLSSKQVLRDLARVLNIPIYKIDTLTKLIPPFSKDKLIDIYNNNDNFKNIVDNDTTINTLLKIALKIEGFPRHISSHAAGILMSCKELDEVIPLTVNDSMYLSGYSMEYLEELGLLKMDVRLV